MQCFTSMAGIEREMQWNGMTIISKSRKTPFWRCRIASEMADNMRLWHCHRSSHYQHVNISGCKNSCLVRDKSSCGGYVCATTSVSPRISVDDVFLLTNCHSMIIPISFRLVTFHQTGRSSNFTLLDSLFLVWTQTELSYSIVSATIPTMRPFISTLNTHFGGIGENESMRVYSFSRESTKVSKRRSSFQIPKLLSRPSDVESKRTESISRSAVNFTGLPQHYNCDVWSSNDALRDVVVEQPDEHASGQQSTALRIAGSSDADEIRPMMIRKEVTYEVQHQNEENWTSSSVISSRYVKQWDRLTLHPVIARSQRLRSSASAFLEKFVECLALWTWEKLQLTMSFFSTWFRRTNTIIHVKVPSKERNKMVDHSWPIIPILVYIS